MCHIRFFSLRNEEVNPELVASEADKYRSKEIQRSQGSPQSGMLEKGSESCHRTEGPDLVLKASDQGPLNPCSFINPRCLALASLG